MQQVLALQPIDLSSLKAIAHNGSCLQVLIASGSNYRVLAFNAPTAALDGLLQLSQLLAVAANTTTKTDDVAMIAVSSSMIVAIGYIAPARILQVDFSSGDRYRYYDVPAAVFTAFLNAPSKGRFLNHVIKSEYAFKYQRLC